MKIKKNVYKRLYSVFNDINSHIRNELDKSLMNFVKIDKNNFNYEKIKTLVLDDIVYRYGLFIVKKVEFGGIYSEITEVKISKLANSKTDKSDIRNSVSQSVQVDAEASSPWVSGSAS
jgi:hypothetical protein